jgi:molybdenum cofactor cytidylyltransferase
LFDQTLFSELAAIEGDVGARGIIRRYDAKVFKIPFAEGAIDLDTPQDLDNFRSWRC